MAGKKFAKYAKYSVSNLFGNQIPPRSVVLAGMADLEKHLTREFDARNKAAAEHAAIMERAHGSIRQLLGKEAGFAETAKLLREFQIARSKEQHRPPKPRTVKTRVFAASISATVAAPFNYDWTWTASTGSPYALSSSAARSSGMMRFNVNCGPNGSARASARNAVGIFFRPMTDNGILRVTARPSYSTMWGTFCSLASGSTDGWIGLYVGEYNLSGGFNSAPVNQQIQLFSDSSWWSGTGWQSSRNSGFPLSAQFDVDGSHWYALWVWSGGDASGAGSGFLSFGGGASSININVPSITWELF
jgi:hypothetical protein